MDASLTGGEVLLRSDIFELIDGIVANRMRYSILSNGTLINEKLLKKFEKGKRRLRLDYIQVSIDSSTASIHNQSRPGSFDKTIRGLKLLKNAWFPVAVRVAINRRNLNDLENIAKLLLEEIGISSFGINDAMPIGSGCRSDADMSLSPKEQMAAMATIGHLQWDVWPRCRHSEAAGRPPTWPKPTRAIFSCPNCSGSGGRKQHGNDEQRNINQQSSAKTTFANIGLPWKSPQFGSILRLFPARAAAAMVCRP